MTRVLFILSLKVAPENRLNILKTIHAISGSTNAQPECLYCELLGSTMDDDKLLLLEKWESQEALEEHIQSKEFQNVMAAIDLACEPPEISFYGIAFVKGIELVEKILEGDLNWDLT